MENTLLTLGGLYLGFKIFEIVAAIIITFGTLFFVGLVFYFCRDKAEITINGKKISNKGDEE